MYLHRTIMHKLLMAILLLGSINQVILAAGGWTPVSQAQSERDAIMSRFFQMRNYHLQKQEQLAGMGGAGSSAFQNEEDKISQ